MSRTNRIGRRSLLGAIAGAMALLPEERAEQVAKDAPIRPRDGLKITSLETFLVKPRWLFLKIHTNARDRRPRRADHRGPGADLRHGGQGDRALPRGQGSARRGPPLAGDLPPRLLPRRADPDRGAERHRPGAVGHQGQGAGRAGVRVARRADAQQGPRLRPCRRRRPERIRKASRPGLHGLQDRPRQAPPVALHRVHGEVQYAGEKLRRIPQGRRAGGRHRHRFPRRDLRRRRPSC